MMNYYNEGATHEQANKAAARFMSLLFGIDMTKHENFIGFEKVWGEKE